MPFFPSWRCPVRHDNSWLARGLPWGCYAPIVQKQRPPGDVKTGGLELGAFWLSEHLG